MIPVTDEMVAAARRQIPERWGLSNLRDAIVAAIELAEQTIELPVTARVHLTLDEAQLRADTVAAIHRYRDGLPQNADGRINLATLEAELGNPYAPIRGFRVSAAQERELFGGPLVTEEGLQGGQDATGSLTEIPVDEPQPHPALAAPLVLGGISEIATRLEVARSTVVGWVNRADKIAMPAPLAILAAGPVYDLTVIEAWYRAWKDGTDAG
jgi:hypothetical protein